MVFGSNIAIYKVVFMLELLVGEGLFFLRLNKRKNFLSRLIVSLAVCFSVALFFPVTPRLNCATYVSVTFFLLFSLTIGAGCFLFDESFLSVLFCALAGYCSQHAAFQTFNVLAYGLNVYGESALGVYSSELSPVFTVYSLPLYVACYAAVYWCVFLLCARRINDTINIKSTQLLFLLVVVVVVSVVINAIVTYHSYEKFDKLNVVMTCLSIFISCILVLVVQFAFLLNTDLYEENKKLNRILREERRQYETSKETIELINVKCHDLKYKIRLMASGGSLDGVKVEEIENAISIYDSFVETGNRALNLVITEKELVCAGKKINFSCVLDGKRLSFIEEPDLYTLFSNALDNAVEAVLKCPEEKRYISLSSHTGGGRLAVTLTNYYETEPKFSGEDIKTSKEDEGFHGFGLKSIKRIVKNYGGKTEIEAVDGVFTLTMIFPVI